MTFARFLYRNLKGYRFLIFLAILLTCAGVGASLLAPFPLKFIIDKVTLRNHPNPSFPYADTIRQLFKGIEPPQTDGVVGLSLVILIVAGLLGAILSFVQLYLASFIAKTLTTRLSKQLFDHLQRLSISWHSQHEQGDLVQRVTGNMADLEKFASDGLVDAVAGILTLVGVLAVMALNNLPLTLLSFLIFPILGLVVITYTRGIKAATRKEKKAEGHVSSAASEAMAKIMEIKAFTLENFMFKIFDANASNRFKAGRRAGSLQAQFTPLVDVILTLSNAIILGVGAYSFATNTPLKFGFIPPQTVTLGTLTVFLSYLKMLYQPMRDLSKLMTLATSASAASERIQHVLDESIEGLEIPADYSGPRHFKGAISFEDVYFCYMNPGPLVLKGITLDIPVGQKVALVGLSGSGKTTLTNLLPRFHEMLPGWGDIKIDGYSIAQYPLAVVRQNISLVLQDSILFDGTIRENIKIGRPNACDAEMIKAAEQACIHETIIKKPGGYDDKITNQGKNLSGGQRQRIAIARAILRNAPIIIMDEPTASLDVEAEAEVMRALDGLAEGRTVLMITHRLSTVGRVDKIVVLKDGRLTEQGTYKELKRKDGAFANLLKAQNANDIDYEASQSFILTASYPTPELIQAEIAVEIEGKIVATRQLDQDALTVGRMMQNDVRIPFDLVASQQVSRLHAKILWKGNAWIIEDADSKYGLHYKGQRISQHPLLNGDRISIAPKVALIYTQKDGQTTSIKPTGLLLQPAQVLIEVDEQVIDKYPLNKPLITIGRKMDQSAHDIQIPSRYIARSVHAQIHWENGAWMIKNMNNRAGICYNGQFIMQHTLRNGDSIYLAPRIVLHYWTRP